MDGSIVVRRSLGRRLKALRLAARKTTADVVAASICSKAKLNRIESGSVPLKVGDVRALCWLYGAEQTTTDLLADLAVSTAREGWWEDYGDVMPPWFALFVELEAVAATIAEFSPDLVPGLLQTPAYHRAVFEGSLLAESSAERQVRLRADRQRAAFTRTPPLQLTAVLGAGALACEVGGASVMAEQREHLVAQARLPHVDVRVLPWSVGAHPAMKGGFTVLGFKSTEDPDVVYIETQLGGRYTERASTVQEYRDTFAAVRDLSVTIEEYSS